MSGKYQVVIPKEIRKRVGLEKGDELSVSLEGGLIVMRIRPKSFTEYTCGLHEDIWKGVEATEYVKEERSSWRPQQEK